MGYGVRVEVFASGVWGLGVGIWVEVLLILLLQAHLHATLALTRRARYEERYMALRAIKESVLGRLGLPPVHAGCRRVLHESLLERLATETHGAGAILCTSCLYFILLFILSFSTVDCDIAYTAALTPRGP
jgi:hypothetical protein